MDAGARGWLVKTARQHHWRVAHYMDLDDLIQDGYMHYWRIVRRYPRIPYRSTAHRMALFKRTFMNHIHDLSKKKTRLPEVSIEECPPDFVATLQYVDIQDLIGHAPPLVQVALVVLSSDHALRILRQPYRVRRYGRDTFNDRLCRLAGLDPDMFNLHQALSDYLHGYTSTDRSAV